MLRSGYMSTGANMKKKQKKLVKRKGLFALRDVELHPDGYECMLGVYSGNVGIYSKVIVWFTRGDKLNGPTHTSTVYVHKETGVPVAETHAYEGWGVFASEFGALCNEHTTLTVKRVKGVEPTQTILEKNLPILGAKYQMPWGFFTKTRSDNPDKWFCSEKSNMNFGLQNCLNLLVSPLWANASPKAEEVYGVYKSGKIIRP